MMSWLPRPSEEVLNDAVLPLRPTVPKSVLVVESKKSMLPVGLPKLDDTVAVKIMEVPLIAAFAEAEIDVPVPAC